jgi:hypothetical protein
VEEEENDVVREDDGGLDPSFLGILLMAVSMITEEVEGDDDGPDESCRFLELLLEVVAMMISEETEEHDGPAVIDRAHPIPVVPVVLVVAFVVRTRTTFLRSLQRRMPHATRV